MNTNLRRLRRGAIGEYLSQVERAIKSKSGVVPEQTLHDAIEFLCCDLTALETVGDKFTDSEFIAHIEGTYGTPEQVADAYVENRESQPTRMGIAPGWRIHCSKCGRSAPASKVGITRIGARSIGKSILGWCSSCNWFRLLRLTRDLDRNNLVQFLLRDNASIRNQAQ